MINALGNSIGRSQRACVASRFIPLPFKMIWFSACEFLMRRPFMKSFQPRIATRYGSELAGRLTDSNLNMVIFYRDVFEPTLSEMILQIVKEGDVCMDAGANVGYFTLLLGQQVGKGGRVLAIEAAPGNVAKLIRNVEINGFGNRVNVIGAACDNSMGEMVFYVHPRNDMLCRLTLPKKNELDYWLMGRKWNPVSVRTDTLSAFAGDEAAKISFLKIDVEGVEHKLCQDILLNFTHPRLCVALEAKAPHIKETLAPFEQAGFYVYDLHNDYRWLFESKTKPVTKAQFSDLYAKKYMVDVLLSRSELALH